MGAYWADCDLSNEEPNFKGFLLAFFWSWIEVGYILMCWLTERHR